MRALWVIAVLAMTGCTQQPAPEAAPRAERVSVMRWPDLLEREQPQPDETIRYGDDALQVIDVWHPDAAASPAVIMIHGGCWQTSIAERDIMNWIAADLRKHGVGVWNIEYRGVDRGGGYPETYFDVGRAADLFRERAHDFGLMKSRVLVIGHSAGGHLALWLAARAKLKNIDDIRGDDPIKVDVAISQGGLPDLEAGVLRTGHPCGTDAPRKMLGPPLLTSLPAMEQGKARQLLFNNAEDHVAPPDYARAYQAKLAAKGVTVEIVETAGEGHVELIAPDSKSWAKQRAAIFAFFEMKAPVGDK